MAANALIPQDRRSFTPTEFYELSDIPPELEWFGNLDNKNTHKAYERDVKEFLAFVGLGGPGQLRRVVRAHVIAWRKHLEGRGCAGSTIRRKLAALSSLFKKLAEENAVLLNPVDGVKRPKMAAQEGATPALSDAQTRLLLAAPDKDTLKGKRDRAILSTLAHHALRRDELCRLKVGDLQMRLGVLHLRVEGKGSRVRYVPVHPETQRLIAEYLEACGHRDELEGPLFRPVHNYVTGQLNKPDSPGFSGKARSPSRDYLEIVWGNLHGMSRAVQTI